MKISDNIMKDDKETVYTPYTYLIGWSKLDKWYYGSRYATKKKCLYESGCHPDDLWKTYHTSSDRVKAFREEHGEPDVIEIDKTFSNELDARTWEEKELVRLNVLRDDKWLNGTIAFPPPPRYGEDNPNYGTKHTEEWKKKHSERMMGEKNPMYGRTGEKNPMYGRTGEKNPNYGTKHTEEWKKKISESSLGEKNPNAKKIKITYLGIEKIYSYMGLATKDLSIPVSTLSFIATGKTKKSRKYPGLNVEYV